MVYESKPAVDSEESDIVAAEGNEEYESGVLGGGWGESYGPPANQIKMASHIGVLRTYVSISILVLVISAVSHGGHLSAVGHVCSLSVFMHHKVYCFRSENTPPTCSRERSELPITIGKRVECFLEPRRPNTAMT